MTHLIAFLAGLSLPFILLGLWWLAAEALSTSHGLECNAGDLVIDTRQMSRARLWLTWRWHIATVGRSAWHREALEAHRIKWHPLWRVFDSSWLGIVPKGILLKGSEVQSIRLGFTTAHAHERAWSSRRKR